MRTAVLQSEHEIGTGMITIQYGDKKARRAWSNQAEYPLQGNEVGGRSSDCDQQTRTRKMRVPTRWEAIEGCWAAYGSAH